MPANGAFCPDCPIACEPMPERRQSLTERLADAVDLMIDFATLGEYGLEPVVEPQSACAGRGRGGGRSDVGFAAVDRADHLPARL